MEVFPPANALSENTFDLRGKFANGFLTLEDGQHRVAALKELVLRCEDLSEEARLSQLWREAAVYDIGAISPTACKEQYR